MGFQRVSYLLPSCDGCGLAWAFRDPACPDGIPPHFASGAAALFWLPAGFGWRVMPVLPGRPLMACRNCAAAGVIPEAGWRSWLLAAARLAFRRRVGPSHLTGDPAAMVSAPDHQVPATGAAQGHAQGLFMVPLDSEPLPDA